MKFIVALLGIYMVRWIRAFGTGVYGQMGRERTTGDVLYLLHMHRLKRQAIYRIVLQRMTRCFRAWVFSLFVWV